MTPATLNGFPVVRHAHHENVTTVMVEKPNELIVATWWPELGSRWQWGHYYPLAAYADRHDMEQDASDGFAAAMSRNRNR